MAGNIVANMKALNDNRARQLLPGIFITSAGMEFPVEQQGNQYMYRNAYGILSGPIVPTDKFKKEFRIFVRQSGGRRKTRSMTKSRTRKTRR